MAEISKDFTNDQSRFEQVVFQRGKTVLDGELNEIGRISRVARYREAISVIGDDGQAASYGFPRTQGIEIAPGANPDEVDIIPNAGGRGLIFFRGYVFELTATVTLTGVTTGVLGANQYQQVYMTIAEEEVTGALDPTIVLDDVRETARRVRIAVTFSLGAVNTNSAGAAASGGEPWEGGTRSAVLAYIKRLAGTATFAQQHIYNRCLGSLDFMAFQDRGLVLGPSNHTDASYVEVDFVGNTMTFNNVGLRVPGMVHTSGSPVVARIPSGPHAIPAAGTCLCVRIPRGRREIGAASTPEVLFSLTGNQPDTFDAEIQDWSDYSTQVNTNFEESFADRFIVATRLGAEGGAVAAGVMLANGEVIHNRSGTNNRHSQRRYFGTSSTLEIHQDGRSAMTEVGANHLDARFDVPYFRSNFDIGRLYTDPHMKLISEHRFSQMNGTSIYTREYVFADVSMGYTGAGFGHYTTLNARWDNATETWTADDATESSYGHAKWFDATLGYDKKVQRPAGAAASWTESTWARLLSLQEGERGGFRLDNTNEPLSSTVPIQNTLYSSSMPKAWGVIRSNGAGSYFVDDGFNIASLGVSNPGISQQGIRVTFARAFTSTSYAVTASVRSASGFTADTNVISQSVVDLYVWTAVGAIRDLQANTGTIHFVAFGRQA